MISLRMTTAAGCLGVTLFLACTAQCDDASPSPRVDSIRPVAVHVRGDLDRARAVFSRGGTDSRPGRVAFIGGSITEMEGYRPMVMADLQSRFPEAQFEFINAGIASTCSHTGAFRLQRDVLAMTPDLLLIEFAVNDDQDAAHSYQDALRGMEGIVRNAKTQLPNLDIVITHFVNQSMLKLVQQGKVPTSIRAHEAVAKHYGISTCNVAIELANQIDRGQTTWKIYGGVHPKPAGNRIAADLISDVFDAVDFSAREALAQPPSQKVGSNGTSTALPPPLDAKSFAGGRFLARRLNDHHLGIIPTHSIA